MPPLSTPSQCRRRHLSMDNPGQQHNGQTPQALLYRLFLALLYISASLTWSLSPIYSPYTYSPVFFPLISSLSQFPIFFYSQVHRTSIPTSVSKPHTYTYTRRLPLREGAPGPSPPSFPSLLSSSPTPPHPPSHTTRHAHTRILCSSSGLSRGRFVRWRAVGSDSRRLGWAWVELLGGGPTY